MEAAKKHIRVIKLNLKRQKAEIETAMRGECNLENLTRIETQLYSEFAPLKEQYDSLSGEIIGETEDDAAVEVLLNEQAEMRKFYITIRSKLQIELNRLRLEESRMNSQPSMSGDTGTVGVSSVKLERAEIPKFDGDILKFNDFKETFENLVHKNSELSNVQKMTFLRKAFIGSAEGVIRHFGLNDNAYAEAWAYVLKRYDNPRAIIREHYRNLQNLETIKSERGIRTLLDKVNVTLRGLRAVGQQIDSTFSSYTAYLVSTRLDAATAKDWENSIKTTDSHPTFDELENFLQIRSFSVEDRAAENETSKQHKPATEKINERGRYRVEKKSFVSGRITCVICNQQHFLNQCPEFLAKTPRERFDVVKRSKLCVKCFNPFHSATECPRQNCGSCAQKHHTLLHWQTSASLQPSLNSRPSSTETAYTTQTNIPTPKTSLSATVRNKSVLLPSAVVKVLWHNGSTLARVLLDNCSQVTLISKAFVRSHKIRTRNSNELTALGGIVEGAEILDTVADVVLQSRYLDFRLPISAEVVTKIPYRVDDSMVLCLPDELVELPLAECQLSNPEVDIIVGAEHYENLIKERRYFYKNLSLRETEFGFVVSGREDSLTSTANAYCGLTRVDIDARLRKFWETEECIEASKTNDTDLVVEHKMVEEFFEKTYSRDVNGRFVVRLPVRPTVDKLHGSYSKAIGMLKRVERFSPNDIRREYVNFMTEYEQLGHMRKITSPINAVYFIPHQMVKKLSSTTTKYRVVFNASCVDASGSSLNEQLMVGPPLQPELFDTIIRFRMHLIAFCADIEKMYRQIVVHPDDRKYQHILWRGKDNEPVAVYELTTVTYGTAPASYLATKCLEKIAESGRATNPQAASVIRNNFYMDDLITGADTVSNASTLQRAVHQCLSEYGFPLRKYQSNSDELLNSIEQNLVEKLDSRSFGENDKSSINLLGLIWSPGMDVFRVVLNLNPIPSTITKRTLLSEIARIFDVLGVLSPITIRAKIMLQDLWRENLQWDDPLSDHLQDEFFKYRSELEQLKNYSIPRCYFHSTSIACKQLIGFCDASPKAYCAIVYMRSIDTLSNVNVKFVCAKTRVASLKPVLTIPRLELQAALLLAKLIDRVRNDVDFQLSDVHSFSDSTIVLSWLQYPANKLKTYVHNRVEKILKLIPHDRWHYVTTKANPADLATRGISATDFLNDKLWSEGPAWLKLNLEEYLNTKIAVKEPLPEVRETTAVALVGTTDASILSRFSSYPKLVNVIARILRWRDIIKKTNVENTIEVKMEERERSMNTIIRLSQKFWYNNELTRLIHRQTFKKSNQLRALDPFLDENNIIRVGGRLRNSQLPYNKRHPIILSAKCNLVKLLVIYIHEKYFHCSKNIICTYMQNQFWVVGGLKNVIKNVIRNCILCIRMRAQTTEQIMGQLPAARVTPSRPFTNVGIDFCGPFTVKCLGHRSVKFNKAYASFFVCFSTRAVHVEVVSDLSTNKFLDAFQRFVARRGLPSQVFSDNGTNFVGANNELQSRVIEYADSEKIKWHFITPRAPHQGGLWEAAVKSGKSLLTKATRNQTLTIEELQTILCRVEAILNSRPLCYQMNADESFGVITPGHFLVGTHLLEPPQEEAGSNLDLKTKLEAREKIVRSFWHEWRKSYLNSLQCRNKWQKRNTNISIGDVVIIKEDNVSVLEWPIGKVVNVYADRQGFVRNAAIKTAKGTYQRAVNRLVKLLSAEEVNTPQPGGVC